MSSDQIPSLGAPAGSADPAGEDPWLAPAELATWRSYRSMVLMVEDLLEQQLRTESGISHQYFSVLVVLAEFPGRSLRMTDLAAQLTITRTRLTYVVQQMQKRGWVSRGKHPEDGRSHIVKLTQAGAAELTRVAPGHARIVKEAFFGRIGPADVTKLGEILETILAGIEARPDNPTLPWRR